MNKNNDQLTCTQPSRVLNKMWARFFITCTSREVELECCPFLIGLTKRLANSLAEPNNFGFTKFTIVQSWEAKREHDFRSTARWKTLFRKRDDIKTVDVVLPISADPKLTSIEGKGEPINSRLSVAVNRLHSGDAVTRINVFSSYSNDWKMTNSWSPTLSHLSGKCIGIFVT